jgi:Arc/MetJ-type ribon-helix-helix transcriptional regulator
MSKRRLSASIDGDLVQAAERAVSEGRAENVSAWVNAALRLQAEHDERLRALDVFLGDYEAKHGSITSAEIDATARKMRAGAEVVRGTPKRRRRAA